MSLKCSRSTPSTTGLRVPTLGLLTLAMMQAVFATSAMADGLPSGGIVTHGQASLHLGQGGMQVHQSTPNAVINWNSFNIDHGLGVDFQVPAGGATLNQISGSASQINGSLTSNGTLFLLNPSGVLFGQGANVNVGALVASTSALNADNFMNGNYAFTTGGTGQISNAGHIATAAGGAVLLAGGGAIINTGTIEAPEGSIQLVSADRFSVTLPTHNPFLNVKVEATATGQGTDNRGTLKGTAISLQAIKSSILTTGVIEASSLGDLDSSINLSGYGVVVTGTLSSQGDIGLSSAQNMRINDATLSAGKQIAAASEGYISLNGSTLTALGGDVRLDSGSRLIVKESRLTARDGDIALKGVGQGPEYHKVLSSVVIEDSTLTATSQDMSKGQIKVQGFGLADGEYVRATVLQGSALIANAIGLYGQGYLAVHLVDGNSLQAQDISIHGDAQWSGPKSHGVMFSGHNQLSAANTLNISANAGFTGVTFDGTTTLDSLHTQVTGSAAQAGITFSGMLDMPQNQPQASATFISNGQEVAPPMI